MTDTDWALAARDTSAFIMRGHVSQLLRELADEREIDSGILAIAELLVEELGLSATLEDLREAVREAEEEYAAEQGLARA